MRGRDDLAALLKARGLDPDRAIADLQAWRERHGFLGPDPMNLTGIDADQSRLAYYGTLDAATLRNLAESGDAGAMQTLAGRRLPEDPFKAIEEFSRAAGMGSAAAMLQISSTLQSLAQVPADEWAIDKEAGPKVLALKRGNADRDLRIDSLAWTLAAIRQYGPAVTDAATIAWVESTATGLKPEALTLACGQSLAIMADISARGAPRDALPPVFTSAPDAYQRLPCGDTPVPISPTAGIEQCESTAARDRFGEPVSVWTCRGN